MAVHPAAGPEVAARLSLVGAVAAASILLAPGVVAGAAAGELLRRRGLRWTWALTPAFLTIAVAFTVGPHLLGASTSTVAGIATRDRPLTDLLLAAAPLWLFAAPPVALAYMLWRNRRDRLRGGHAEQSAASALGPLQLHALRRAAAQAKREGPRTAAGLLLGHDELGAPIRIPALKAHATIVGGSNSGKTNTAEVLLEAHVAGGGGFVVLDGKGGRELPRLAVELAARHARRVSLWSIRPYGDPNLDRHRRPWNAVGDADPTEVKDRIAASEEQTEPYYAAVAARGLLAAARLTEETTGVQRLDALAASLEDPSTLGEALEPTHPTEAAWLTSLVPDERAALRGMATRLRTMTNSDGAEALLPPRPGEPHLSLHEAITQNHLVVFTLPQGLYPDLVPHVTRYAVSALNAVCTRIEQTGAPADAMVFVDELSAFDGDGLCAGFERGRSAGVRYLVATQSLSNLASAGGDKLLHAALDNAELIVIHRQAVPDAAEALASIGGTEEAWEHTHKVSDAAGLRIGWDETGERARRLTDRFRAHPNVIKALRCGEAVLVTQRPEFAVRRVRIRPGPSAR